MITWNLPSAPIHRGPTCLQCKTHPISLEISATVTSFYLAVLKFFLEHPCLKDPKRVGLFHLGINKIPGIKQMSTIIDKS